MPIHNDDDDQAPYAVHETYLAGMLGNVVSRHETLDEAIAAATNGENKRAIVYQSQIIWPRRGVE